MGPYEDGEGPKTAPLQNRKVDDALRRIGSALHVDIADYADDLSDYIIEAKLPANRIAGSIQTQRSLLAKYVGRAFARTIIRPEDSAAKQGNTESRKVASVHGAPATTRWLARGRFGRVNRNGSAPNGRSRTQRDTIRNADRLHSRRRFESIGQPRE
jgi:hypothetical protein